MSFKSEMYNILNKLGSDLLSWLDDLIKIFDRKLSKELIASISWEFLNKQLSRKVEKFYILVQDAVDDTEILMHEYDISELTTELKNFIQVNIETKIQEYQKLGIDFVRRYEVYEKNLDTEIWLELKDIVFHITADNIINIIEEQFNG